MCIYQEEPWHPAFEYHIGGNKLNFYIPNGTRELNQWALTEMREIWDSGKYDEEAFDVVIQSYLTNMVITGQLIRAFGAFSLDINRMIEIGTIKRTNNVYRSTGKK